MTGSALLLGSLLLSAGPERGGRMSLDAPLECPSTARFEQLVARYLGRAPGPALEERGLEIWATIYVGPSGTGWQLELESTGADDPLRSHLLRGADCDELAARAAAVAATTIDPYAWMRERTMPLEPDALTVTARSVIPLPPERSGSAHTIERPDPPVQRPRGRPSEPASSTAPAPEADDALETLAAPERTPIAPELTRGPDPVPRATPPLHGFASTSAGVALNLLAPVNPGVHAQLGLERGRLRLSAHGGFELAGRFRSDEAPEIGGDLRGWALGLRGCFVPRFGRLSVRACGSAAAGQLRGQGVGVVAPRVDRQPWVWLAPELGVGWQLGPSFALVLDLGLPFAANRPSFRVEDPAASFVLPVLSGQLRLGVELRFPRPKPQANKGLVVG